MRVKYILLCFDFLLLKFVDKHICDKLHKELYELSLMRVCSYFSKKLNMKWNEEELYILRFLLEVVEFVTSENVRYFSHKFLQIFLGVLLNFNFNLLGIVVTGTYMHALHA